MSSPTTGAGPTGDIEREVIRRYAAGAEQVEAALCCAASDYDTRYLEILPEEIIAKDYGCGDPSKWVSEGEHVVDLGSGAGKVCYILAQKVGSQGSVTGVDFNDTMLALARKHRDTIVERIGYDNVRFVKGRIQDLALDLDRLQQKLADEPVASVDAWHALEEHCRALRTNEPMIADSSIDAVVSNCVLNLVRPEQKEALFAEIFRVLRPGGRAVISDVVCDETPTDRILNDPELWSGCIAGAFVEHEFLQRFERAGFYGVEILERQAEPWQVIDGVEFRSMTVRAYKAPDEPCMEHKQAIVYRGPWSRVTDDDGHALVRGRRTAVCDRTYRTLTDPRGPYRDSVIGIEPLEPVDASSAGLFDCSGVRTREPRETKGDAYRNGASPTRSAVGPDDASVERPSADDACGPGCC